MAHTHGENNNKIRTAFMELYRELQPHEITVKMICGKANLARTSFYNYYSDVYDVLESIEDELISDLKEINRSFAFQNFHNCEKGDFHYFFTTLDYIKERQTWFRALLNKSKDGTFIYKWKKIIRHDFAQKYHQERITLENEALVLEMIASAVIGVYMYWVNNLHHVTKEDINREVLYRLCQDFM